MRTKKRTLLSAILSISFFYTGCFLVDNSPVASNTYEVLQTQALSAEIHIGHDIPVSITIKADYDETTEIPVQFYLLNKEDVEEVENGLGDTADIRIYRPDVLTLDQVYAGSHEYAYEEPAGNDTGEYRDLNLFNLHIPADQGIDKLTGDHKIGTYHLVAVVDKDGTADIDAYEIYKKMKDNSRQMAEVTIPQEALLPPDLSYVAMNFTGDMEDPKNAMTYMDVVVPDPNGFTISIDPSEQDRIFTGNITVRSSSKTSLNVPIRFELSNESLGFTGGNVIKPQIYDNEIQGWMEVYYAAELKPNIDEDITVALKISETDAAAIKTALADKAVADGVTRLSTTWTLTAMVNDTDDGATHPVLERRYTMGSNRRLYDNNYGTSQFKITYDRYEVEKNAGIVRYVPYDPAMTIEEEVANHSVPLEGENKVLVIFHDEFKKNVGSKKFGGGIWAYERAYFVNFSCYQTGVELDASLFGNSFKLVDINFDAFSFPKNAAASGYNFFVEAFGITVYQEGMQGHIERSWSFPIPLYTYGFEKKFKKFGVKLKIGLSASVTLVPTISLWTYYDGALRMEKSIELMVTGQAALDVDAAIVQFGIEAYLKVIGIELLQQIYTETDFQDSPTNPGTEQVAGALYKKLGVYLNGPEGWLKLWVKVVFVDFDWTVFSFTTFKRLPLWEMETSGSGLWTNYQDYNPQAVNEVWEGIDWEDIAPD